MRLQGMATVKRSPGKEIPLSQATTRIKGRLIVYQRNGRLIAASWPRKRTTPYTEEELAQQAEFKALALATKYIDADTAVAAREIAAHSKHTWRDIVSRMMTGTLVELENYGAIVSQYNLDILTEVPGSIIYRDVPAWKGLDPGIETQVLTIVDGMPSWQPVSFEALGSVNGMIPRRAAGLWSALSPGSANQLLTMVAGLPEWRDLNLDVLGSTDGMMVRRSSGAWRALSPGLTDQILTIVSGIPEWRNQSLDYLGSTTGAIVRRISTGWQILAPGTTGQVLTILAGLPAWQNPSFEGLGSSDGMIARRAAGAWAGLAIGSTDQVLTVNSGLPAWQNPSFEGLGSSDGMIARRAAGAWGGLAIGSSNDVLTVSSGAPSWQPLSSVTPPTWAGSTKRLVSNVTPVGIPAGTTATVDLQTYSLPAGTLAADGDTLEIFASGTAVSTSNNRQPRLVFGATSLGVNFTTTSQIAWQFQAQVVRVNATNQIFDAIQTFGTSAGIVANAILRAKPTETLSGAITIKTTGAIVVATLNGLVSEVLQVSSVK